jgi:hypothetical protein
MNEDYIILIIVLLSLIIPLFIKNKDESYNLSVLSISIGIILIIFAIYIFNNTNVKITAFFTCISGAFIGSGASALISQKSTQKLENNIYNLIDKSYSDHDYCQELSQFRKKWHIYHITNTAEKQKKEFTWRYTIWDFSLNTIPGKLSCEVQIPPDSFISKHEYTVDGRIKNRSGQLIACTTNKNEKFNYVGIYIFPTFGEGNKKKHCGFCFIKSPWSSELILSPCLISEDKIIKTDTIGSIKDNVSISILNEELELIDNFTKLPIVRT